MESPALVTVNHTDLSVPQLTATDIKSQVNLIQQVMQSVMQEGVHYGVIPGTNDKPTLLKPGAEKLTTTFRLAPKLTVVTTEYPNGHREEKVTCQLTHFPTGQIVGEGIGSCSTLESKYRWRSVNRKCPHCNVEAIIKGKAEYGGGWLCFNRKGGCGAKFADADASILSQEQGRVENPDIADVYNTVLKMAKKRALIDATLTATAASDCFNQDLDDFTPEQLAQTVSPKLKEVSKSAPASEMAAPGDAAEPSPVKFVSQQQIGFLMGVCKAFKVEEQKLIDYLGTLGIESRKDIPATQLDDIVAWVKSTKEAK